MLVLSEKDETSGVSGRVPPNAWRHRANESSGRRVEDRIGASDFCALGPDGGSVASRGFPDRSARQAPRGRARTRHGPRTSSSSKAFMAHELQPHIDRHTRNKPDGAVDYVPILHVYPKHQRPAIGMSKALHRTLGLRRRDALERELDERVQPGDVIENYWPSRIRCPLSGRSTPSSESRT